MTQTTKCRVPEGHRWNTNGRCEWCDAELIDIFAAESDRVKSQTTRLPNWKSQKFRDGMAVGAAIVLLPIFLWVVIHG